MSRSSSVNINKSNEKAKNQLLSSVTCLYWRQCTSVVNHRKGAAKKFSQTLVFTRDPVLQNQSLANYQKRQVERLKPTYSKGTFLREELVFKISIGGPRAGFRFLTCGSGGSR